MTTPGFSPVNSQSSYLPPEFDLPKDNNQFYDFISKRERLTANIINIKENGNYETVELLSAQQWFSTQAAGLQRKTRYTYRKVVDFGALPNAGTKTVAHGITIDANTIFTRIYATATNPNTTFIPIPYINTGTPGDSVEIFIDTANVNIKTTTANYIAFTTCYVILEYIKF